MNTSMRWLLKDISVQGSVDKFFILKSMKRDKNMKHKHFALKAVISVLIFAVLCMSVIFCINYGKSIRSQYFYTNTTDILGKNIDEVSEKTGIDFENDGTLYRENGDSKLIILNELYKYGSEDVKIIFGFYDNILASLQYCFNDDDKGMNATAKLCRELYGTYEKKLGEPVTYPEFSKPMEETTPKILKESGVWEYWETSDVDWSELLKRYADDEISRIDFSIRGEFSSVTIRGYFQRNKKW